MGERIGVEGPRMMPPFMAYKTGELVTLHNETEKREEGAGFSRSYRI